MIDGGFCAEAGFVVRFGRSKRPWAPWSARFVTCFRHFPYVVGLISKACVLPLVY